MPIAQLEQQIAQILEFCTDIPAQIIIHLLNLVRYTGDIMLFATLTPLLP